MEEWQRIAEGIARGRLTGSTTHARILAKRSLALQAQVEELRFTERLWEIVVPTLSPETINRAYTLARDA